MKRIILSILGGTLCIFLVILILATHAARTEAEPTEHTHVDYVSALQGECFLCGNCSDPIASLYWGEDNVGIINTGNLVAYDTPQGLKDSLLESNRQEMTEALSKISDENDVSNSTQEDIDNLSLRKMSILLKNQDDEIIESIKNSDDVKSMEIAHNGRINLRIDSFDDMAVQNVLDGISFSGGIIKSVSTEEPSLEDVFIKSTSEVNEDDRA